jgi:hypothetical protein
MTTADWKIERRLARDRIDGFLHDVGELPGGLFGKGLWLYVPLWSVGLRVRPPHFRSQWVVVLVHFLPLLTLGALLVAAIEPSQPWGLFSLAAVIYVSASYIASRTADNVERVRERLGLPRWSNYEAG